MTKKDFSGQSQTEPCDKCYGSGVGVPKNNPYNARNYPAFVSGPCGKCDGTGEMPRKRRKRK